MLLTRFISLFKQYLNQLKSQHHIILFDIVIFLRQFATLISASIPIIQSCEILEKSQEKIAMRLLIYAIKRDILAGKTLHDSLKCHSPYFDDLTCQLILIGEHTGKLDVMLTMIANHQEKNLQLKKKIKQALFYPCMILMTASIVTMIMLMVVVPKFAVLFHDIQNKLPVLTLWIFYISIKLQQHLLLFLFLMSCIFLSYYLLHKKSPLLFKQYRERFVKKLPFVNTCLRKILLARFARNLAITFAAGIPIRDALTLTANTCHHLEFNLLITKLRTKISAGHTLHHAMEASLYFSNLVVQMVKIGEESGNLEHMLDKVADFFEADIHQQISLFSQLLEPLLMVVLGVLIGGLVIGMYLPLFKLGYIN